VSDPSLLAVLTLQQVEFDRCVGRGPKYPWGGLYGGQIVAQALVAASATVTATVTADFECHSLRAYFIRRGDHELPVDYEVDRIRDGRSFCTRRVVARQGGRALLNLEASYAVPEHSDDITTVTLPVGLPTPEDLPQTSWSPYFERAFVPSTAIDGAQRSGAGRATAWLRATTDLSDRPDLWAAALVYLSDDLPTDAVVRAHPLADEPHEVLEQVLFSASLDHSVWFHRPVRPDHWHVHDLTCQTFVAGRGLSSGHLFDRDGRHVATIAQEVLLRDRRRQ